MNNGTVKTVASGETGGFVACKNSQGTEMNAPILRMTRHQVTFEVSAPQVVLRTSEVLSDFKVTLHDATIYSGRAVVGSLINAGSSLICEALVEDGWQDANIASLQNKPAQLQAGFNQFVQQWQRLYRIRPELKVDIADMQVFLTDLRRWLEQVELGIRATPGANHAQLERDAINELSKPVVTTLNALFEKFETGALEIDEDLKLAHHTYIKRQLHPLVMSSPFAYRTFAKPLGYAGDYEMVNMILRDPQEGASMFAKLLNIWFLFQPPAEAHRNRVKYLTQHLVAETARVAATGRMARIFNLGCGPAGEIQRFIADHDVSNHAEFTLLDFNDETLAYTANLLNTLKNRHKRSTLVHLQKKSVAQMLRRKGKPAPEAEGKFDFVYCAGLFDYLPDSMCRQLMNIFYDMLAPNGLLLATNVDSSNPRCLTMEYVLEWNLIYRSGAAFAKVRPDAVAADDYTVESDITGVNIYLKTRKRE